MTEEKQTSPISEKDIPPWLQPVADEEEESGNPLEGKKMILITAGVAVTVVALFVLVLFYLYNDSGDSTPRYVEADPTPVRERPADPGGMDVPHQDKAVLDDQADDANSSVRLGPQAEEPLAELPEDPAVGTSAIESLVERVTREVEQTAPAEAPAAATNSRQPEQPEAPSAQVPQIQQQARAQTPETETAVSSDQAAAQPSSPVYRVQLGAYGSQETAARAWRSIKSKYQSILGELTPMYEAVQSGDRTLYRLRVGPLDTRSAADEVCLGLRAQQQACIVVNP